MMADRPDVDTLAETVRVELAVGNLSKGMAALSDLAARAREQNDLVASFERRVYWRGRAEAAEADRDRLQKTLDTEIAISAENKAMLQQWVTQAETHWKRVTELEAALQRIADADGLTIPGHDTTATYARSALAGDGVDREALSSERTRQGLTDSAGIARTELAGDGGGA